jgi:thioredoxin-related protein
MRQLLKGIILLSVLCAMPAWAETRSIGTHFFQPKLGDFKGELETVKKEGKKGIFLFFEMDECPWCARMKATILNQSAVQDFYRAHYLVYSVDVKGDVPMVDFAGKTTTEKAFALEKRVRATPTMLFIDGQGKIITRFTGPTRNADEMMLLGRYVLDDAYKQMPFTQYKQAKSTAPPARTE